VVAGIAVLSVGVLFPLYRTHVAAQTVPSLNSLPTRLVANPDGSATVSFKGTPGAAYQIYYSDSPAASPEKMQWSIAADDLVAATNTWTEWIDAGDANRPRPGAVQQRYYRVVLKPPPPATATPPPPPLMSSTSSFAGFKGSLE